MYKRIMLPLDGTWFGEYAAPAAAALARRTGAELALVHVHEYHEHTSDQEGLTPYRFERVVEAEREMDTEEWDGEAARLSQLVESLRMAEGIEVSTHMLHGGPIGAVLLDHARETGVDFVVMATHGRGGPRPFGIGSVARFLVHNLEVPVLVMRPGTEAPAMQVAPVFQHVLVPLDGTPRAEEVLPAARQLATPFGSSLSLLRVIEHGMWPMNVLELQMQDALQKGDARSYLDYVASRIAPEWVTPEVAVTTHTSVAKGILEAADTLGADLIAMATHGRTGLSRLVLGSVAEEVLEATRLPLLLFGPAAIGRLHRDEKVTPLQLPLEAFGA